MYSHKGISWNWHFKTIIVFIVLSLFRRNTAQIIVLKLKGIKYIMVVKKNIPVSQSKFSMWRAAIALAHCDHRITNSEAELIHNYSEHFDFSESQKLQLAKDFQTSPLLEDLLLGITDKKDMAHLINFARVLFHIDGDFCDVEQKIMDYIYDKHMNMINLKQALNDAKSAVESYEEQEKLRKIRERKTQTLLENAFEFLTGIDI